MNAPADPQDAGLFAGSGTSSGAPLSRGWIVAAIAGAVALLLIAAVGTIALLRDDPTARWAAEAITPNATSPSAPSPSPTPSPTPAEFDLAALKVPTIESVMPRMPRAEAAGLDDLPGLVAVPENNRTPVWAEPDDTERPRLALAAIQYEYDARWLVLRTADEWTQVLLPYGRRALPSSDPGAVNGAAGWVKTESVRIEPEDRSIVIDLSDRAVIVDADGGRTVLPAAIGAPNTPTPRGVSQIMTVTEASNTGLSVFLSAQSEALDTFAGVDYAATALHVGLGQGQEVSNGCIRLTPEGLEAIKHLPAGVPVVVRA